MKVTLKDVKVSGVCAAIPKQEFDLLQLGERYGELEVKKIIASTGVSKIRVAPENICTSDLCEHAATSLFARINIEPSLIDGIVFVSQTFDHIMPATSVVLQHRLLLPKNCVAFDIRYGCSGYIYGLYQAALLVSSGSCQRVLVCVGDVSTHLIHPDDRALRMVMGDGGSATIVERGDGEFSFNINSDGGGARHLIVPAGGCRVPSSETTRTATEREGGNSRSDENMFMDGMEIMNFCLREVPPCINELLDFVHWQKDDVGLFGLHQANKFIVDYLQKKLKVPKEKVPVALQLTGNTGPASIPLMLAHEYKRLQEENRFEKSLLCAYGVGLSWGAVALNLSETIIMDPVEL